MWSGILGKIKSMVTGWYDQLIAADPGFNRLRSAARATLTITAMVGVVNLLAMWTGNSIRFFFIGVVVSMISSFAVTDPGNRQKMITMALIPFPAMVAVTAGSFLQGTAYIPEAVFVVITFIAVYIRRFGPRWFAFGMIMFISYFFVIFLGLSPQQLPWLFVAIFSGAAVSFLFRFLIIRDVEQFSPASVMPAVRARLRLILKEFRLGVQHPEKMGRHYNRMRRQEVYLSEATLLEIGREEDETWDDAFLDINLAAQHIVKLGQNHNANEPGEDQENLLPDIDRVVAELRSKSVRRSDELRWAQHNDNNILRLLQRVVDAVSDAGPSEKQETEPQGDDETSPPENQDSHRLLPTTRQAVQVAVASTLAIAGGELLSEKRWYWAVITAFIIFTGTSSRGHVFVKGWQRVVGTLLGVGAGILIATLVSGNVAVSSVLLFVSFFLGLYFRRISYAIMIFCITIMLALLYGLMGFFSISLLSLRLEETLIGAVAGAGVALFLFPAKTRDLALRRSRDFLKALDRLITQSAAYLREPGDDFTIPGLLKDLDNAYQELRQASRPLTFRIHRFREPRTSQHWLRVMLQLRYQAHVLARLARIRNEDRSAGIRDLTNFSQHLSSQIHHISQAIEDHAPGKKTLRRIQSLSPENPGLSDQDEATVYGKCLGRISCILKILARDVRA